MPKKLALGFSYLGQISRNINVWSENFKDEIFGHFFVDNFISVYYLILLHNTTNPLITEVFKNTIELPGNQIDIEEKIVFEKDGCSTHYTKNDLNPHYPNRWMDRRESFLECFSRSTTLTSHYFFSFDTLENNSLLDATQFYSRI